MAGNVSAFQTKESVLFIKKEVTAGTPVPPTSGGDAVALQDGFSFEPTFNTLENGELNGSLDNSAPIQGLEEPTASLDHYIRHSGVEGTAPNYDELLEGVYGAKVVASTEFDVIGGSTAGTATAAATLVVDTGEGVNFERGQAVLIKDGINGFSIRNVKSVSTDTLTLNFNLDAAPALGVNLGKAVLYKPASSHPCLSLWNYRGGGHSIDLISGGLVTSAAISVTAGELINGSFSVEGIEYSFNPLTVDATNDGMDFNDGGGEENATITQKTYKDPHDLAAAIESSMDALTADVITVTYSNITGKYTIATDGGTLTLLWDTGSQTATTIGDLIGFDTSADDSASTTYTSDNAIDLSRPFTPTFDSTNPLVAKDNEVFLGDFADNICFKVNTLTYTLTNTKTNKDEVCATTGRAGSIATAREGTVELTAYIEQFDVDKFKRFRTNETTEFAFNFGTKVGGNWEAGKSVNIYIPTAKISSYTMDDLDGLVVVTMTLTSFGESGLGSQFLNFL